MKCSSCGEYDLGKVDHGPGWEAEGFPIRVHQVCGNCDAGLCGGDC